MGTAAWPRGGTAARWQRGLPRRSSPRQIAALVPLRQPALLLLSEVELRIERNSLLHNAAPVHSGTGRRIATAVPPHCSLSVRGFERHLDGVGNRKRESAK